MIRRKPDTHVSAVAPLVMAAIFVSLLGVLGWKLKTIQVDAAAGYSWEKERQSIRRVETAGVRGRILDCKGRVLADVRRCPSLVCRPEWFQRKSWEATTEAIMSACRMVASVLGRDLAVSERDVRRHVKVALSMPLYVCRDLSDEELVRFIERAWELPGFEVVETMERIYPQGRLFSHVLGYVGRDRIEAPAGDVRFSFAEKELRGRSGIEYYYDSFLRGVSGERDLLVDARGFTVDSRKVSDGGKGPDLTLTLDAEVQSAVREQLAGLRGACVVLDANDGGVVALVSTPDYDLNSMVPTLSGERYRALVKDPGKPLLNRAIAGSYAPGSTFKPVTALAALSEGVSWEDKYECTGAFEYGEMTLHCTRRWGHGELNMKEALRDSCNPFFCNLGNELGTNALCRMARTLGLGRKTGIDAPDEVSGVVPDGEWKKRTYGERWYPGDLVQMAIGQGMLLVTPLQMACIASAIGTGKWMRPHLRLDMKPEISVMDLPFGPVREGMRMVVERGGTGVRGAEGVKAQVIGKTGTAEIGKGATRRKNTWFIAYAENGDRRVSVAMVVENGEYGGSTTAPRVAAVLRRIFG